MTMYLNNNEYVICETQLLKIILHVFATFCSYLYIYSIDKYKPCDQSAEYNCRAKYTHKRMK